MKNELKIGKVYPFPNIYIFFNVKKANKFLKKKYGNIEEIPNFKNSYAWVYFNQTEDCIVMLFNENKLKHLSKSDVFSMAAHECYHAIGDIVEVFGDRLYNDEMRAYLMQDLFKLVYKKLNKRLF